MSVALLALINVPLLTEIPFGLATITCALSPATSRAPFIDVELVPVTSFKIVLAVGPTKLGFPMIYPASSVFTGRFALFKISPFSSTLNALYWLWDNPLSLGVLILTTVMPFLASSIFGPNLP